MVVIVQKSARRKLCVLSPHCALLTKEYAYAQIKRRYAQRVLPTPRA